MKNKLEAVTKRAGEEVGEIKGEYRRGKKEEKEIQRER